MITRISTKINQFPRPFWVLMGATFIDQIGSWMLFPFFALYITDHFNVGMTEAGVMIGIFSITNMIGGFVGGALTDKFGRKTMLLFGLAASGLSSLLLAYINDLNMFYLAGAVVGLVSSVGFPAQNAMIADLLPEDKQTEGFGIGRVFMNLAVVFGPLLGGVMAARSFRLLFFADAITSMITALIVYLSLPETKPEASPEQEDENVMQTFYGYIRVLRDSAFMTFLMVVLLMNVVYMQLNSTLSVYLRDVHGLEPAHFGYLLSLNAIIVVLFQFWVAARVSEKPPMLVMAFGTIFYMIGFGMYGFVAGFVMFAVAMVILTIGEIIIMPVMQALVVKFSPEDMRGRYMGIFGLAWMVPSAVGPLLAGLIIDNYDPNWVWYAGALISLASILGFLLLHAQANQRLAQAAEVEAAAAEA